MVEKKTARETSVIRDQETGGEVTTEATERKEIPSSRKFFR
jgi:hypothetical protein